MVLYSIILYWMQVLRRTARLNWANPIIEIPAARPFCLGWIFGAGDELEQFELEQENTPILVG